MVEWGWALYLFTHFRQKFILKFIISFYILYFFSFGNLGVGAKYLSAQSSLADMTVSDIVLFLSKNVAIYTFTSKVCIDGYSETILLSTF